MTKHTDRNLKAMPLSSIRIDGDTQPREAVDQAAVDEYAEALEGDGQLPPGEATFDGKHYWLWDGFHRFLAHQKAGRPDMLVNVGQGTLEDARWRCLSANRTHGLRRTNADKRAAVVRALSHPKGQGMSDRAIAEHCGVSHNFVGEVRRSLSLDDSGTPAERVGRDGRTTNTTNIGRRRSDEVPDDDERDWSDEEDDPAPATTPPADEEHEFFRDGGAPDEGLEAHPADVATGATEAPKCPAGLPLPPDKAEAFAALAAFRELELHLRKAQKLADVLSRHPGGMFYDRRLEHRKRAGKGDDELRATSLHVANAIRELVGEQPHASTCPYCAHDGEVRPDCQACLGQDWVTRGTWESAPDDYRDEAVVMAQGRLGRAEA